MWYEIINPVAPSSLNPIRAGRKSTWPVSKGPGLKKSDTHAAAFYRDKDANHEKTIRPEDAEERAGGARAAGTAALENTEYVPHRRHRRLGRRP